MKDRACSSAFNLDKNEAQYSARGLISSRAKNYKNSTKSREFQLNRKILNFKKPSGALSFS